MIMIMFKYSDGAVQEDGFYFDDLIVTTINSNNLSTPDFIQNNFTLYPNPVNNRLNIKTSISNYDYKVYSIHGQLILEKKNINASTIIEYSNITPGVYFIDIKHDKGYKTFKIIKK